MISSVIIITYSFKKNNYYPQVSNIPLTQNKIEMAVQPSLFYYTNLNGTTLNIIPNAFITVSGL